MWMLKLDFDDWEDEALIRHAAQVEEIAVHDDDTLVMKFDDMGSMLATVRRIHEAGVQFMYRMESAWLKSKRKTPGHR